MVAWQALSYLVERLISYIIPRARSWRKLNNKVTSLEAIIDLHSERKSKDIFDSTYNLACAKDNIRFYLAGKFLNNQVHQTRECISVSPHKESLMCTYNSL